MGRTVHVVRPPAREPLDVVDGYERLILAIDLTKELWRLLDREENARAIQEIVSSAYGHEPPMLGPAELRAMLDRVTGLDKAVVGPLTDADELLTPEKVIELRGKSTLLDLDESRGADARSAVSEALFRVTGLERALMRAIEAGYYWVFG